ncbi:MAG TPA: type VI secretion system baseplate subunit TssF [Candidatus Acidoferrales bacterium]|nr:type VI secretion system baseplate subunit TssF [Candidatus Acidoferrales bacterium]
MRDDLLTYYERELAYLRHMGAEFAEKYPKIASRLLLEPNRSEDPHVERIVESFAYLAARIHLKLDDDFPEITEALLSILYPHYLRPIPSVSVVEFQLDPEQGKLSTGLKIPRESMLYSRPVGGFPCKFRTCYDVTLWPLRVAEAQWVTPDRLRPAIKAPDAVAALRVQLDCLPDVSFENLGMNSLRFYLNGEGNLIYSLYELLFNNCTQVVVRDLTPNSKKSAVSLPASRLRAVGFSEDEALLPYSRRSFSAYRLLQEYFSFPEKFLFFDLTGLDQLARAGFKDKIELIFLISPFERDDRQQMLELGVSPKVLRLGCSPIINLFPVAAEPILLDQTSYEYPIIPDVRRRRSFEVFSVDGVVSPDPQSDQLTQFEPFYRFRHAATRQEKRQQAFWYANRRPSGRRDDEGTEVFLSLVDLTGRPARPAVDTVTVRCTCTNRDLPFRLPFGGEAGDFEVEGISSIKRIVTLRKPTATIRPPMGKGMQWRLISHLSLNYLSLVSEGKEALQEILRLYNFSDSTYLEKQIAGITRLGSSRHFARVISEHGISFVRGTRVELELDEEQFVGGGAYLFSSVLEHFLGLYASLNSFTQLVATTQQRKEGLREWPARAGQSILL